MKNLTDKEAYNENIALDRSLWKMSETKQRTEFKTFLSLCL